MARAVPGAVAADHEQVEAWIAVFESELIEAATDVRMAKDTENH